MRIISGQYRGYQIRAPKHIPARPTTDRSKESLFNILQNKIDLEELGVLDLCSGTGNISYEFASRGAQSVTSVDQSHHAVQFIKSTFQHLGYSNSKVVKAEALQFMKRNEQSFDLIFADPPYAWNGYADLINLCLSDAHLREDGLLIVEHETSKKIAHPMLQDFRQYGQSAFSIFQKKA